ncbi:hypothetical protein ASPBRDRAFT_340997 [Aspergillus brasiliensis CBS 101740]|uniref:Uncharacterized protein n=1 Tax=Aspergillus brasiliensis (strain CBS 101740 / IMI 381727 / IBT 21946) TaxID=767769 RepID=A0A1L9U6Y4_ASPBC|nr:hypothetical protein ASPBRDRAFT_340997 [Aspergillus brasiliensis CBS 101740]
MRIPYYQWVPFCRLRKLKPVSGTSRYLSKKSCLFRLTGFCSDLAWGVSRFNDLASAICLAAAGLSSSYSRAISLWWLFDPTK